MFKMKNLQRQELMNVPKIVSFPKIHRRQPIVFECKFNVNELKKNYDDASATSTVHVPKPSIKTVHVIPLNISNVNDVASAAGPVRVPKPSIKTDHVIPLNIFQTWNTLDLPQKMKENIELLKRQNPEFTHYLYDDEMCREFIKNNFDEDVVYSFDKLIPGAYKADLWRYCVIYIKGGIYLDIKYNCVNNFKLIELTDKEYYVKDRLHCGIIGIYQALLVNLPRNKILYNCINDIVKNVKNCIYGCSELIITGPHLLSKYFNNVEINDISFEFDGKNILFENKAILTTYKEYRHEQGQLNGDGGMNYDIKNKYYKTFWNVKNIYNYPILNSKKTHNYTRYIYKIILGKQVKLYSGTPTIIKMSNNSYLINIRWINYNYNVDGSKKIIPKQWISINSKFLLDLSFNQISEEIFLEENFDNVKSHNAIGLEDIRIFNYEDTIYYISSIFDNKRQTPSISSNVYDISDKSYNINRNIILPNNMYNLNKIRIPEKNWSFVKYKNDLCIVYNWFPLQIGKIDYIKNQMNIIEVKENIPDYFKNARGSTPGYIKDNEIWFVLHKAQTDNGKIRNDKNHCYNYQHFFAIFDFDMNLIRYSELFKLGDCKVEFCIGLIVNEEDIILSYSLLDTNSIISTYDINYINNGIKWY